MTFQLLLLCLVTRTWYKGRKEGRKEIKKNLKKKKCYWINAFEFRACVSSFCRCSVRTHIHICKIDPSCRKQACTKGTHAPVLYTNLYICILYYIRLLLSSGTYRLQVSRHFNVALGTTLNGLRDISFSLLKR